jgi:hypothetical protein
VESKETVMGLLDGMIGGVVAGVVNNVLDRHGGLPGVVSAFERQGSARARTCRSPPSR